VLNRAVALREPLPEVRRVCLRRVFPDEVAAVQENMAAVRHEVRKQLPVRRRDNRVVLPGEDDNGSGDLRQEALQTGEVTRVCADKLRGVLEPASGRREPVVFENRVRSLDRCGLSDEADPNVTALCCSQTLQGVKRWGP
jgi:hypothetical protein